MGQQKDNQKINNVQHKKNNSEKKNNYKNNFNYKKAYDSLVNKLKKEVDRINSSDYSKKSLGKFKEKIEKILYYCLDNKDKIK
ncbi:hypothetical protein ACOAKC_03480 [Hathewaya histolytica]|uniref:hypothetical protein n=1 Tax=Hathewaya histolytica TaxID=1498 RepID=UPI003B678561